LALDTSVGSRLFELAPDVLSPLSPFDEQTLSLAERMKSALVNALWQRADRTSPAAFQDISSSARRRWKADPSALPEGVPYRPPPLGAYQAELDALPALPPAPEPGTFDMVRAGPRDTLSKIAKQHLADPERWLEIFAMNQDVLEDPDHIYCGTPLRIPKH
jgi:nucleoid-associated protein YgaU